MHFELTTCEGFKVEHGSDCALPGYLVVSPVRAAASISELPAGVLLQLGPVLSLGGTRACRFSPLLRFGDIHA